MGENARVLAFQIAMSHDDVAGDRRNPRNPHLMRASASKFPLSSRIDIGSGIEHSAWSSMLRLEPNRRLQQLSQALYMANEVTATHEALRRGLLGHKPMTFPVMRASTHIMINAAV